MLEGGVAEREGGRGLNVKASPSVTEFHYARGRGGGV